jgi:hypothetical protein
MIKRLIQRVFSGRSGKPREPLVIPLEKRWHARERTALRAASHGGVADGHKASGRWRGAHLLLEVEPKDFDRDRRDTGRSARRLSPVPHY